jgi:hypothetical protein
VDIRGGWVHTEFGAEGPAGFGGEVKPLGQFFFAEDFDGAAFEDVQLPGDIKHCNPFRKTYINAENGDYSPPSRDKQGRNSLLLALILFHLFVLFCT